MKIDIKALRELHAQKVVLKTYPDGSQLTQTAPSAVNKAFEILPALLDRIEELEGALRIIDALEDPCNEASSEQSCVAVNALTHKEPT